MRNWQLKNILGLKFKFPVDKCNTVCYYWYIKCKYIYKRLGGDLMKAGFYALLAIIGVIVLAFALEVGGLKWERYFAPQHENVKREVFENTQSYVHGKSQDLAKYYEEYSKADDPQKKEAIASIIKMNFADFDVTTLRSEQLKGFLISVRGY